MRTSVVATNSVHTSAALCDYLRERVDEDDAVHVVNPQFGGDQTSSDDIRDGEDAPEAAESRLGDEEGPTVIESSRELASYLGEYWTRPSEARQTLLNGSYSRVGIGSYVGDQEQQIAVAASLCG